MNLNLDLNEIAALLSPAGRDQIIELVREARESRGRDWIAQIKSEIPYLYWIVDLAANYSAEEAFGEIEQQFKTYPVWLVKSAITDLHGRIRAEIDKPRG